MHRSEINLHRISLVAIGCALALTATACASTDESSTPQAVDQINTTLPAPTPPCDVKPGPGDAAPPGSRAGDLISAHDLTPANQGSLGFPNDGRVFRILYVSTKNDEDDLVLVCGLVAAPAAGPKLFDFEGLPTMRMVTRNHGTIGMRQRCLPSSSPDTYFWGPSPGGMGSVTYGTGLINAKGMPENGMLQFALDEGWVISASDYVPDDTYLLGRVAAANVIDAARAAQQLIAQEFPSKIFEQTDLVLTGHSQGGHATIWTGQLFDLYQKATPQAQGSPKLRLLGMSALAPASNFIVQPDKQPAIPLGNGLADWEMHQEVASIGVPIRALELEIGPALAGYIFASWSEFSKSPSPQSMVTPAAPRTEQPLRIEALATDEGTKTIMAVNELCLGGKDLLTLKKLTAPYADAATHRLLIPQLWNLPTDYQKGQYFKAAFDQTCAGDPDQQIADWCTWLRWNLPGPNGVNPFPKTPRSDGTLVPTLIAHGLNDTIVHCVNGDAIPSANDCMSIALFESLAPEICVATEPEHFLKVDLYRHIPVRSPASHLSLPGQFAAKGLTWSQTDLTFKGSRWQTFISDAFTRDLPKSCEVEIVNQKRVAK